MKSISSSGSSSELDRRVKGSNQSPHEKWWHGSGYWLGYEQGYVSGLATVASPASGNVAVLAAAPLPLAFFGDNDVMGHRAVDKTCADVNLAKAVAKCMGNTGLH